MFCIQIRHPDCFASLEINGCELGLNRTGPRRNISAGLEVDWVMVRMDAFVRFIEGMFKPFKLQKL